MPKIYKNKKKYINPRYFLNETSHRDLINEDSLSLTDILAAPFDWIYQNIDKPIRKWFTGFSANERADIAEIAKKLLETRGDHEEIKWGDIVSLSTEPDLLEERYQKDKKFRDACEELAIDLAKKADPPISLQFYEIGGPAAQPAEGEPSSSGLHNFFGIKPELQKVEKSKSRLGPDGTTRKRGVQF